jgi:hypothetical protein
MVFILKLKLTFLFLFSLSFFAQLKPLKNKAKHKEILSLRKLFWFVVQNNV